MRWNILDDLTIYAFIVTLRGGKGAEESLEVVGRVGYRGGHSEVRGTFSIGMLVESKHGLESAHDLENHCWQRKHNLNRRLMT